MERKDIRIAQEVAGSAVAHRVTVTRGSGTWVVRDDGGLAPIPKAPCTSIPGAPAVACPDSAQRAFVGPFENFGLTNEFVVRDLVGLAVEFNLGDGPDIVDVRGGGTDEVACGDGEDAVMADDNDRAYGDCETLNGEHWQDDATLTDGAFEYDGLDDLLAWTDKTGALVTVSRGGTPSRFALSRKRRIERLNLGREAGHPVAAFRATGSANAWYVLDLFSRRLRSLRAPVPSGCRSDSLAVWDGTITVGATCGRVGIVVQRRRSRTRRVLRLSTARTYFDGPYGNRGVWLDARESNIAIKIRGDIWLAQAGASPCTRRLESSNYEGPANWVLAPPRLAKDRILWPGYDASEFFTAVSWIETDDIQPRCKTTRNVVIIPTLSDAAGRETRALAATAEGDQLARLVGRRVLRRPLTLTPWPVVPRPFWGEH